MQPRQVHVHVLDHDHQRSSEHRQWLLDGLQNPKREGGRAGRGERAAGQEGREV